MTLKNLKKQPFLSRNMGQKWAYYWKILTLSDTAKRTMKSIEKVKCRLLQLFCRKLKAQKKFYKGVSKEKFRAERFAREAEAAE